ncbi:MAG: AAA family ATPase, partial [Alphaproteobacteria bacterium]|nr:AAA family ATPase [Alphaproteobacteria bacterium]
MAADLHRRLAAIQRRLHRQGGAIHKVAVDNKGIAVIAAMGLPGLAHEDDPARAVRAALDMADDLAETDGAAAIGIATGRAYCGMIGDPRRCEYTIIGDIVNLSARLMQAAHGGVLCDAATAQACGGHHACEPLGAIKVKGKADAVPIFRPGRERAKPSRQPARLIGRDEERERLRAALNAPRRVVLVEGEPGIGKSVLIDAMREDAARIGLRVIDAAGDALEATTPYHPWRDVFRDLLGPPPEGEVERSRWLAKVLPDEPMAPLFSVVLPFPVADDAVTGGMTGQLRAENTRALLLRALARLTMDRPPVIVLEDAHWFDSASWALLIAAARLDSPPPLVVTIRRDHGPPGPVEWTDHLELRPLPAAETAAVAAAHLEVDRLPDEIVDLLGRRAAGHPLFGIHLAEALRREGLVEIADGRCRMARRGALDGLKFPDSIQALTVTRVDALEPARQVTLKAASVIGPAFTLAPLVHIHPLPATSDAVSADLEALAQHRLTEREPGAGWRFPHAVVRETVYDLLLFAQRRALHEAVARWYEATPEKPGASFLAHHWSA